MIVKNLQQNKEYKYNKYNMSIIKKRFAEMRFWLRKFLMNDLEVSGTLLIKLRVLILVILNKRLECSLRVESL